MSLPARIRAGLWAARQVDTVAIWLVDHGHSAAAQRLWWATRTWGKA